jgi:hypothetical protein
MTVDLKPFERASVYMVARSRHATLRSASFARARQTDIATRSLGIQRPWRVGRRVLVFLAGGEMLGGGKPPVTAVEPDKLYERHTPPEESWISVEMRASVVPT